MIINILLYTKSWQQLHHGDAHVFKTKLYSRMNIYIKDVSLCH